MGMAFKSDACDVLLECDIVAHGERCDTHPHRRWGVMILDLRKRLAADLALHPNWEARALRFYGSSGIRTSMRSTPALKPVKLGLAFLPMQQVIRDETR